MKRITDRNPNRYKGRTSTAWKKLQILEDIEELEEHSLLDIYEVFKIMRDNNIDVNNFIRICKKYDNAFELWMHYSSNKLTLEKFDLLREILL